MVFNWAVIILGIVNALAELILYQDNSSWYIRKSFSITGLVLIFKYFGTSTGFNCNWWIVFYSPLFLSTHLDQGHGKKFSLHKK